MLARNSLRLTSCLASASTSSCPRVIKNQTFTKHFTSSTTLLDSPSPTPASEKWETIGKDVPNTIFNTTESAWDHVFEGINDLPPLLPPEARRKHRHRETHVATPTQQSSSSGKPSYQRRVSMTARELSVFHDMFNLVFDSMEQAQANIRGKKQGKGGGGGAAAMVTEGTSRPTLGIGHVRRGASKFKAGGELNDLMSRVSSRYAKNVSWTTSAEEELDRKKEEMAMCNTDQQLLEWAIREVFGESKRYEERARQVLDEDEKSDGQQPPLLQPLSYPFLVASLMQTFRDKYSDPHLALSIFSHARDLSIPSYVFGCTTPAYNEFIETKWRCFRDLRGVCDALEEMRVNGITMDNRTRGLAETIRKEVGERNLWEEESSVGSGEVWEMLKFVEQVTVGRKPLESENGPRTSYSAGKWTDERKGKRKGRWMNNESESWKTRALDNDVDDDWEFGKWEMPEGSKAPSES